MALPPSTITISPTAANTWQISSSIPVTQPFMAWISADGRGSFGFGKQPRDTRVSTDHPVETLVANTNGQPFSNPCGSAKYTGNPSTDLACIAQAAVQQGYDYAISDSWAPKPPCKCP